jgi:glucose/arabinose dehydrogenase
MRITPLLGLGLTTCALLAACSDSSTTASDASRSDGARAPDAATSGGVTGSGGAARSGGASGSGGLLGAGGMLGSGGVGGGLGSGGSGDAGPTVDVGVSLDLGPTGGVQTGGASGNGGSPDADRGDAVPLDAGTMPDVPMSIDVSMVDVPHDLPRLDTGSPAIDVPATSSTCVGPSSAALANAGLPAGYCAWTWASSLNTPRGITRNARGDMVVVEQGQGRISLLFDDDGNGVSGGSERATLVTLAGLNHGIAINAGYLYASTTTTVYRWAYTGGRDPLGASQTVVTGLPTGGHSTRTLLFDGDGNLYVSVGSGGNVDSDPSRARVLRYQASVLGSPSTFAQGEVFANGLRNEVGLALDDQGRVWGVENGRDDLQRTDLGGDIHNDNPAEELNLFAQAGRFYGYPYCWSEGTLTGGNGPGTQWADPQFMNDGTHSDSWCRNPANVVPPVLTMQAHSAPLDIKFYGGTAFPSDMQGSAVISFHGSWNRSSATGYKVVRVPFANGMPSGAVTSLLEYSGAGDTGSGWPHRPVGIEIGTDGRLFVTSDASGIVIAIGHQ